MNIANARALRRCRRIVVLAIPPVQELDFIGPMQVFNVANRVNGRPAFCVEVVSYRRDLEIEGEGGLLSFRAGRYYADVKERFDSLLVVCGLATRTTRDPDLSAWLRRRGGSVRRVGAVCVGAFLLAEAGLLARRRATAHWRFARELATRFPTVKVESDPIWVRDGNVYTSAGVSAGIDLALAWVEEDCGSAIATDVARELVLFLRRPGSQKQVSMMLDAQGTGMQTIRELLVWMAENLHSRLSVERMASRAAMSVRNFERVFRREVGVAPARYLLRMRVDAAVQHLERTDLGLDEIARATGFAGTDQLRRAFVRVVGTTPSAYRQRLRSPRQ
jgi:transcriptional regulator GlxA family with amidase domain